jgi:hypothetical protein
LRKKCDIFTTEITPFHTNPTTKTNPVFDNFRIDTYTTVVLSHKLQNYIGGITMNMNTIKAVEIKLSYEEAGFKTEKRLTLYRDHVTELELKDQLKAIKAVIVKAMKTTRDNPWVEVDYMDMDYHTTHQTRVILNRYMWDDTWEMDYRRWTGHDFSDKKEMHFATQAAMIKFAIQDVEKLIRRPFRNMPEERSVYMQSLDAKDVEIQEGKIEEVL